MTEEEKQRQANAQLGAFSRTSSAAQPSGASTATPQQSIKPDAPTVSPTAVNNSISGVGQSPQASAQDAALSTRNVDGTKATAQLFNAKGESIDSKGAVIKHDPRADPTLNPTNTGAEGSVYDIQGGVHDNPLYDYNNAPEVDPRYIERLRVNAMMGNDGPQLMGWQKALAGQLLDADASGPSFEREALLAAKDHDPMNGSIRSIDPNAYAEQGAQADARANLGAMSQFYAQGREGPQSVGAEVDQSLGGNINTQATKQRQVNVGPTERAQAVELAPAAQASAATVAKDQQQQLRDVQVSQAERLNQTASGQGPSLTDAVLQKGVEASLAAQVSGARASRGFSKVGGLQRNLANSAAIAQANAAGQAGALSIQERQQAEGLLSSATTGARQQDIGLAATDAGFQQQANITNAAATNETNLAQGALSQNNNQFNAGQTNAATSQQADINAQAAGRDAEAANVLNRTFIDRDSQMKLANLDVTSKTQLANLDAQLRTMGLDDNMRINLMAQELTQANTLAAQGISYDSAAVAQSVAKDNARRDQANADAARTQQYVGQVVGALSNVAANA